MPFQNPCFLVDNDEDDREIFVLALQEVEGKPTCATAAGGPEALEKLKSDPQFSPSVIFLDMNMPLMNGTQCLREIRDIERLRETPVYIFSTSSDPTVMKEAKRLGANDFLVKPARFNDLVSLLTSIFQQ